MDASSPILRSLRLQVLDADIRSRARDAAEEYIRTVGGGGSPLANRTLPGLSELPSRLLGFTGGSLRDPRPSAPRRVARNRGAGRRPLLRVRERGESSAAVAAKWIADVWDQNAALYVMSPIASALEAACEEWLVDLLGLPKGTAAGLVGGTSVATLCGLAAGRDELLRRAGWDVGGSGLFGAPEIRVVIGGQAHASVFKALSLLGLGRDRVIAVPVDGQGRMSAADLPPLDARTLLILQAGNVSTGAFDPFAEIVPRAREAGAWVHVDGAFGLWAAASPRYRPLMAGAEGADSWSADAHKTLNAPYDIGVVFCRRREALAAAMRSSGSYFTFSEQRDGMLYTPDMSRRARGVELWATLMSLGRTGAAELVEELCAMAWLFAGSLAREGFRIRNDVVFNQVLVTCDSPALTQSTLEGVQRSGECWCGGTSWAGGRRSASACAPS